MKTAFTISALLLSFQLLFSQDNPPVAYSGSYTVGNDGTTDFSSLTGSDGLFEALNAGIILSDILVEITTDLDESGLNALEELNDDGNGHTVTIQPASGSDTLKEIEGFLMYEAVIKLDGADNIIIDGGSHQLSIRNSHWKNARAIEFTGGASNNTIRNCWISTGWRTNDTYCIYSHGADNDSNTYENNILTQAFYGIGIHGTWSNDNTGNRIINNIIGDDTVSGSTTLISYKGIDAAYQTGFEVKGNEIRNMICYNIEPIGIYLFRCNSTVISGNYIHDLLYTKSSGYGADGIFIWADEGTWHDPAIVISNNVLRRITGPGTSDYITTAIYIAGNEMITEGISILHNSIYLSFDPTSAIGNNDTLNWSAGVVIENGGPTGISLVNNIILNETGDTGQSPQTTYGAAIWVKGTSSPFDTIDHNLYYASQRDTNVTGFVGTGSPPISLDIEQWRCFTGRDSHSQWANPLFTNDMLDIQNPGSPALAEGEGFTGIEYDFRGNPWHVAFPSVGAHESLSAHVAIWTGVWDSNWNETQNWAFPSPALPDSNSYLYIPGSAFHFPVIPVSDTGYANRVIVGDSATILIGGELRVVE
jgi:hypothetical protein